MLLSRTFIACLLTDVVVVSYFSRFVCAVVAFLVAVVVVVELLIFVALMQFAQFVN